MKYGVGADFGFRPATEQEQAEAYVREQRPALMELTEGCLINLTRYRDSDKIFKIISVVRKPDKRGFNDKMILHRIKPKALKSSEVYWNVTEDAVIIGHPINLQDWLAVLNNMLYIVDGMGNLYLLKMMMNWKVPKIVGEPLLKFNMQTGQPATQQDYKAFNDIVSV